ncbi:MAG TPA: hypothetical protein VLH40_06165 [Atribacteraceae bacterium]|nr:hypothetical protein [Atribacteraceae bacterium]
MENPVDLKAIESSIENIDGVVNVRVMGDGGVISEIHVLSNRSKPPRLLARDIETLLHARYNLDVDHKKISIVSFDLEGSKRKEPNGELLRPVLWSLGWKRNRAGVSAEVEIRLGEKTFRTEVAEDHPKASDRIALAGEAVLRCINDLMGGRFFTLRGISTHSFSGCDVVLVVVDYRFPDGEMGILTGAAVVKDDLFESAARGTLDALNRKILVHLESV